MLLARWYNRASSYQITLLPLASGRESGACDDSQERGLFLRGLVVGAARDGPLGPPYGAPAHDPAGCHAPRGVSAPLGQGVPAAGESGTGRFDRGIQRRVSSQEDLARIYDSPFDDHFNANATTGEPSLFGQGVDVKVFDFPFVYAIDHEHGLLPWLVRVNQQRRKARALQVRGQVEFRQQCKPSCLPRANPAARRANTFRCDGG